MLTKNTKTFPAAISSLFLVLICAKLTAIFSPSLLGNVEMAIDEAQYIFWSKHLAAGYFSKPPFIAWILSILTPSCDDNYQCFRSLQPLAFFFTSIFCGVCTFEMTRNFKTSCFSGIIFYTLPLSTFYGQFATTDAWLLLFWSASTYSLIKFINTKSFL